MNPNNFNYRPPGYQVTQQHQHPNLKQQSNNNQFQISTNPYSFQNIQMPSQGYLKSPVNSYSPYPYQNQTPNTFVTNSQRHSLNQLPANMSPPGYWNTSNLSSNGLLTINQSPSSNLNYKDDHMYSGQIGQNKVQRSKSLANMTQLKSSNMIRSNIDQRLTTPSGNYQPTFFQEKQQLSQQIKKPLQSINKLKINQDKRKQERIEDNLKYYQQINPQASNILKNMINKFTWYYEQNDEHLIKLKYLQKIRENMSVEYFLEQYQKSELVKSFQKVQENIKQFLDIETQLSKNLSSSHHSFSKKYSNNYDRASDDRQDQKYLEYFKEQLENQRKKYEALEGQIKKKEYILEKEKDKLLGIIKQKNSELQLISSHIGQNKSKQDIIFDEEIQPIKSKQKEPIKQRQRSSLNSKRQIVLMPHEIDSIVKNFTSHNLAQLTKEEMFKVVKQEIITPIIEILQKKVNKSMKEIPQKQTLDAQLKNHQGQFMDLQMKIMNIQEQYQSALKKKEAEMTELKRKLTQSENKNQKLNQSSKLDKAASSNGDKIKVEVQQIILDRLLQQIRDLQSACEILRRQKQQLLIRINEIWQQYEKQSPKNQSQIDKMEFMKQSMGIKITKRPSEAISIKDEEYSPKQKNKFMKLQNNQQLQYSLQQAGHGKKSRQFSKSQIQDRIIFNDMQGIEKQERSPIQYKSTFKYQEQKTRHQQQIQSLGQQIEILRSELMEKVDLIQKQQQQNQKVQKKIDEIVQTLTEHQKSIDERNKLITEKDKVIQMRNFDIEELEIKIQHIQGLLQQKDIKTQTILKQLSEERNLKEDLQRRLHQINPQVINIKMIEFKNKLQLYQDNMKHLSDFFTKVQHDKQKYDKIKHQNSKNAQLFENKALYKLKEQNQLLKRKVYGYLINIYSNQSANNQRMEKSMEGSHKIDASSKKNPVFKMPNSYTIEELLVDCILQLQPVIRWGSSGNISPQYQLNLQNLKSYLIQSQKKLRIPDRVVRLNQNKPIKMRASTVVKSMKTSIMPQIEEKNQLIRFYKNQIQVLQKRVAQLLEINIQMKEQFSESIKQKNKKGNIEVQYLSDQIQNYKKKIANYETNMLKLQQKPKKSTVNKSIIQEKEMKVASLQNQLQQAYNKQFDLMSLLKIFENSIMVFSETIRKLESRLRQKLNKDQSSVSRQIFQYIEEIQISVTNYFKQIAEAKNKYNHLNKNHQNNFYEETVSPVNFEIKQNLDRRSEGYNKNASIRINLYPQYEKKELILKKQISNMNDHAMTVRSELPDNNTTIIQQENYKLKEQIKKLNQYVTKLPNDPTSSMLRLRTEKTDLQQKVKNLQYQLSAQGSFKATIQSLRSQNAQLKSQIKLKDEHSIPLLEKIKRLQFIIEKLEEEIKKKGKQFEELKYLVQKLRSNLIQNGSLWEEMLKINRQIESSHKASLNSAYTANVKRGFLIIEDINKVIYK